MQRRGPTVVGTTSEVGAHSIPRRQTQQQRSEGHSRRQDNATQRGVRSSVGLDAGVRTQARIRFHVSWGCRERLSLRPRPPPPLDARPMRWL